MDGSKVDRETTPFYNLEIAAVDNGNLNSTVEITVRVLDINDNWPEFDSKTVTEYSIEENQVRWETIINATDFDLGQNASLFFYMESTYNTIDSMQKFRVEPLTGAIELISPLDYENKTQHRIVVTCSDQGVPEKLKNNVEIIINVIDLNDNGYDSSE